MAGNSEVTSNDAGEVFASGRRYLAIKDYSNAVTTLGRACELLASKHGEQADECAEPYLWYGKALLGLSREESGVLGDRVPQDDGEEEKESDEDQDENEGEESDNGEKGDTEQEKDSKTAEAAAEKNKNEAEAGTSKDEPGTSNAEVNGDESAVDLGDDDDVENLQLAWEMLDLSRSILEKRVSGGGDAARALLSEVHLTLGEVALESETYDKAVLDMQNCLEIQKKLYKNDDRRIAETHYQIALANSLASNFEEAIIHFKNAANILETRIKTLENADDATLKKTNHATQQSANSEVKELRELLPEINEKIQDMMDYKAETLRRLREQLLPTNGANGAGGSGASDAKPKQASDISHLIKRKRNSDQEDEAAPAKNSKH